MIKMATCSITNDTLVYQDEILIKFGRESNVFREIYQELNPGNIRFGKMSNLCKSGFLGVEVLKKYNPELLALCTDSIGMVFGNVYSSMDTDLVHLGNLKHKSTSPAVFVYTLPNIVMGEIAIFNKWYGESLFIVGNDHRQTIPEYTEMLLHTPGTRTVIAGTVEYYAGRIDVCLSVYTL